MRRQSQKSEVRFLVYSILALVLAQGHLAGSPRTIPIRPVMIRPYSFLVLDSSLPSRHLTFTYFSNCPFGTPST
jgi:hypothetical protein